MKVEVIKDLSLADMKQVAKNLGIVGWANFNKKASIMDKINEELELLGLEDVPDIANAPVQEEVHTTTINQANTRKRIKDYPRKKVTISCRDENVKEYPFSVNEYLVTVQMEKEVNLPLPVIDFIRSIKQVKFEKNSDGYGQSKEVNKFFINYI